MDKRTANILEDALQSANEIYKVAQRLSWSLRRTLDRLGEDTSYIDEPPVSPHLPSPDTEGEDE
tara:strand:- start:61 stop:252 length:192 start_codon:yes stop_codon:yes gene_type:complete